MQYLLPKFALYPAIIYMLDIHSQVPKYFGFHIHNIACGLLSEIVIITYLLLLVFLNHPLLLYMWWPPDESLA